MSRFLLNPVDFNQNSKSRSGGILAYRNINSSFYSLVPQTCSPSLLSVGVPPSNCERRYAAHSTAVIPRESGRIDSFGTFDAALAVVDADFFRLDGASSVESALEVEAWRFLACFAPAAALSAPRALLDLLTLIRDSEALFLFLPSPPSAASSEVLSLLDFLGLRAYGLRSGLSALLFVLAAADLPVVEIAALDSFTGTVAVDSMSPTCTKNPPEARKAAPMSPYRKSTDINLRIRH